MGIPLESAKSSSDNNFDEPRLPNTAGKTRKSKSSLTTKQSQKKSGRLASDSIGYYLSSIGRVPLLTPAEEIELAHHVQNMKKLLQIPETDRTQRNLYQIKIGKRSRDRMMAANLRLVVSVAKKYQNQGLELLDLVQEGAIGLERAVDKFDPAMGYKFSTYAYWWIRQGMTRAIDNSARTIRLPIHISEKLSKMRRVSRELSHKFGRQPTRLEMAIEMGIDQKDLMSEIRTQSRPYAEAAFEVALADDTLDAWTADFSMIELALEDQKISQLVETPSISQSEKTNIFCDLFKDEVQEKFVNFLSVAGSANRLRLLTDISKNFKELVAKEKNLKNITVASSYRIDKEQLKQIEAALKKRMKAEVSIVTEIDKSLIGGLKISYDDQVIDLSIKNKLEKLKTQLRT